MPSQYNGSECLKAYLQYSAKINDVYMSQYTSHLALLLLARNSVVNILNKNKNKSNSNMKYKRYELEAIHLLRIMVALRENHL